MARSVPELADILRLILLVGGLLGISYLSTLWLSRRARTRYRAFMRETERSLIGQRVLVTKTITPPAAGEIIALNRPDEEGEAFAAQARHVLWAGQRARVVSLGEHGYVVAPLDKQKNTT